MPAGTPTATASRRQRRRSAERSSDVRLQRRRDRAFGLTSASARHAVHVFIIFQLARESKAGRFGTFVLFLALGFGLVGFAAKA